jgi:outer membrane protein assembly factor BamB
LDGQPSTEVGDDGHPVAVDAADGRSPVVRSAEPAVGLRPVIDRTMRLPPEFTTMPSRRHLLGTVAAGLAAPTVGCLSLVEESGEVPGGETDGPGFSGLEFAADETAAMVRYDGANTCASSVTVGPAGEPTAAWRADDTLGSPARPTVLSGAVFTHGINGICGFTADGDRRWAYDPTNSELNPGPLAVVRDRVFASRGTALFALDAKTGGERWVADLPAETNRLTPPAVDGDTVYVGGQHPGRPPTLWAVSRSDGSVRWQLPLGGEWLSAPVIGEDRIYAVATAGGLFAVDTDAEAVAWDRSVDAPVGVPAVRDGAVVAETDDGVVCYDADGSRRWASTAAGALEGPHDGPVVADGTVYAGDRSSDALVALHLATGDEQWRVDLRGTPRSPVVTDETVYAHDTAGGVRAVRPDDGATAWSTRSATGIVVGDGAVFVGADDKLVRYD